MDIFPVEKMSVVLKVSSSGFYKWLTRPKSNRELRTESLSDQIRIEYEKSNRIYGSPRITQELRKKHRQVSRSICRPFDEEVEPEEQDPQEA